jgi:hypothetical protein
MIGWNGLSEEEAMNFRCIPIDTRVAERFRSTGVDDRGNPVHHRIVDQPGAPCRHCLRPAEAGEEMLLLSWDLPRPQGVYWTPSPIFLHARDCAAFGAANMVPEIVRKSLVSVRAYDRDGMCLYDLGQVSEGAEVDGPLARALSDHRTDFVNIHTARPGCLLCQAERVA